MKDVLDQRALEIEKTDDNIRAADTLHDVEPTGVAPRSRIARIVLMSVR